jgi:hypothetical protein
MKPNSSWSLRANDNAPQQPKPAGAGGGGAAGGDGRGTPLLERRIVWFVAKSAEKRATHAEIAEGLKVSVDDARATTKGMVRKGMLRELPKTAERPNAQFAVATRLLQEAAQLAAGPDPATL